MAGNMFVKFDTIKGECEDREHKGWSEITSVKQTFSNEASPIGETDPDKISSTHSEIEIEKYLDSASIRLMVASWFGDVIEKVTIQCFRDGGTGGSGYGPGRTKYFEIELKQVIIQEYEYEGKEDDIATESLKLVAAEASYSYDRLLKDENRTEKTGAARINLEDNKISIG
jgi:type VI secretion system secreted protein Hcp